MEATPSRIEAANGLQMNDLEPFGMRIRGAFLLHSYICGGKKNPKSCHKRSLDGTVFLSSVADISPHLHSSLPSSQQEPLYSGAERRWNSLENRCVVSIQKDPDEAFQRY